MSTMRSVLLSFVGFVVLSSPLEAGPAAPKDVADYLATVAGFPPDRLAALETGAAIVRTTTENKGEISVVGAVRIRTTKEHVQLYFDDYMKFED